MINYHEIDGPDWFDKTLIVNSYDKPILNIGVTKECLLPPQYYIGIELISKPTIRELVEMKKLFHEVFDSSSIRCFTTTDLTERRFAAFFGFEEKEMVDNIIWHGGDF